MFCIRKHSIEEACRKNEKKEAVTNSVPNVLTLLSKNFFRNLNHHPHEGKELESCTLGEPSFLS